VSKGKTKGSVGEEPTPGRKTNKKGTQIERVRLFLQRGGKTEEGRSRSQLRNPKRCVILLKRRRGSHANGLRGRRSSKRVGAFGVLISLEIKKVVKKGSTLMSSSQEFCGAKHYMLAWIMACHTNY